MDVLYKAQQYLYGTWLPSHKLQTEPFCGERYESHTPKTAIMEVWLKLVHPMNTAFRTKNKQPITFMKVNSYLPH